MCRSPVILPPVVMRGTALGLVLLAALAGCSADAEPKPLPPLPSVSPAPVVPQLPPEATPADAFGARAFTRHFFDTVNDAYASLDPSRVEALSASQCNSCKSIMSDIERLKADGLQVAGSRFKLDFAEATPPEPDGSIFVDFGFDADAYVEKDASGRTAETYPARQDQEGQARLVRTEGGWRMSALRLVSA
jgi:hypothetical protein